MPDWALHLAGVVCRAYSLVLEDIMAVHWIEVCAGRGESQILTLVDLPPVARG